MGAVGPALRLRPVARALPPALRGCPRGGGGRCVSSPAAASEPAAGSRRGPVAAVTGVLPAAGRSCAVGGAGESGSGAAAWDRGALLRNEQKGNGRGCCLNSVCKARRDRHASGRCGGRLRKAARGGFALGLPCQALFLPCLPRGRNDFEKQTSAKAGRLTGAFLAGRGIHCKFCPWTFAALFVLPM